MSKTLNFSWSSLFSLKTPSELVAEIHDEIDSAQENLLAEAELILSSLSVPENPLEQKAIRLSALGFVNAETVKKSNVVAKQKEGIQKVLVESMEQADLIRYYKFNYPFLKFLTEDELSRICTKYDLVSAPVANYIKDVPEVNIGEIENAQKLSPDDYPRSYKMVYVKKFWHDCPKEIENLLKDGFEWLGSGGVETQATNALKKLGYTGSFGTFIVRDYNIESVEKDGLFICAPASHFDLGGVAKKTKTSFFNVFVQEVKDPIVFRYCRGGVQVLSKWGLEASDEGLINERMN